MKTTHCLLAAILLSALGASAPAADTSGLQIKNKSKFTAAESMHNPFWPIGWTKTAPVALAAVAKTGDNISTSGFTVTSILLGNPAVAVINGRDYQEGDMIRVGGVKTNIEVVAIRDGEVVMRSGNSQIKVTMKRR
jgi:hypothetical protein